MNKLTLQIVSGGQTGVDRVALDTAIEQDMATGGWCPDGRLAEDGTIPSRYPLQELPGGNYCDRTKQNVIDSDGTLIVYFERLSGGTKLTHNFCLKERKPYLLINGLEVTETVAAKQLAAFVEDHDIKVLNVAGPRVSNESL